MSSVHGSPPWRVMIFSSGKNQHTSSSSAESCGAKRMRGPGTPAYTKIGMSSSTHFA